MYVRFRKTHEAAVAPARQTDGACGYDLTAVSMLECNEYREFDTGIAVEIPRGFVGLLVPRSSISKTRASMAPPVGIIDADFRGSMKVRLRQADAYKVGQRIAQLLIVPAVSAEWVEVEHLSTTERGESGYGSTGY